MATKKTVKSLSAISKILGVSPVLLGENPDLYESGLAATIAELEANTPLQIYLAEKIFDSLWWIGRYETQKRAVVISEMVDILDPSRHIGAMRSEDEKSIADALFANQLTQEITARLKATRHSIESLRALATSRALSKLKTLDELIALHAKTLSGFQASYEVAVSRKINRERLMLQNDILRRDLGAIAHDHGKPATGESTQRLESDRPAVEEG